jgi:lysozyme
LQIISAFLASVDLGLDHAGLGGWNALEWNGTTVAEELKIAEGFCSRSYLDLAGIQTIGYGHRLLRGAAYLNVISHADGEAILAGDVREAEESVVRLVKVPLWQGQFDAPVDFAFNLGATRLAGSTNLKYLNQGKYDSAAWQLLAWDHSGLLEIAGLKARRETEFRLWAPLRSADLGSLVRRFPTLNHGAL